MRDVLKQEQELTFKTFTNQDALNFGLKVLEIVEREQLRNIRIRVKYDNDIIFQYMMNGKVGDMWLNRKENTVMESKHSSLYVFEHESEYAYMKDNDNYAVCGGGFPLVVDGELRGCFIVSGLEHEEDHDLIIKALKEI